MATVHPASPKADIPQVDHRAPSKPRLQASQDETSETGFDLEAALPRIELSLPKAAKPRASKPAAVVPTSAPEISETSVFAEPTGTLIPPGPSLKIEDSSAAHLGDSSAAEIDVVDRDFQTLLTTVRLNRPADDLEIIRKAWQFCLQQHDGQKRASGEPYVIHPLEVGQVLAELKMDSTAIAAGLLHDAVEDTDVTSEEIAKRFGEQVAHIVEGVTKLDKIKFANREDHQAENIRKMLLAMVTDIRVVIIKLADRLHNMRTLEHLKPEKQQKIARETLDIYAPLAHRLGMGKLRGELEDLAFRYTDPFAYEQLTDRSRRAARRRRDLPQQDRGAAGREGPSGAPH